MGIHFADVEIDDQRREFRRAGARIAIEPKVFDLILYLLQHRDRVVPKDELLGALCPDQDVFEGALTVCIHRARTALTGAGNGHDLIRNFARRGYRMMAEVSEGAPATVDAGDEAAAAAESRAQRAFARLDFEEAAVQFDRAAALLAQDHPEARTRHVRLLIGRGEALYRAGDEAGAREAFRLAEAVPKATVHPGESESADAAHPAGGDRFLALVRTGIEVASGSRGGDWLEEISVGAAALDGAAEQARESGDITALASVLVSRSWVALSCELPPERLQRSAEAFLLAEAVGKPFLVQDARLLYIHDLLENGRVEDAAAQIESYAALATQAPSPVYEWVAGYLAATRALLAGRLAESQQLALDALAKGAVLAPEQAAAIYAMQLVTLKAHQGHLGEMVGGLELLLQRYPEHPMGHATLSNAYCEIGRMEDARVAVDKAIAFGVASGVLRSSLMPYEIASLAPACAALGDTRRAASLYETLLPWSGMHLVSSPAVAYIGPVNGFLGILACTAGMWPRAQQHFEAAVDDCTRMQSRSMLARTKLEYARGLLQHGKRRAALAMLDDAARIAVELDRAGLRKWIAEERNG